MYQNDGTRRGVFYANRLLLEMLHSRRQVTTDADKAALFFVPVMLVQMGGNLWQPQRFLAQVVSYIQQRYPFWNRTGGTDHVFITTQARGSWPCRHAAARGILIYRETLCTCAGQGRLLGSA
jgi:hypothetical protein